MNTRFVRFAGALVLALIPTVLNAQLPVTLDLALWLRAEDVVGATGASVGLWLDQSPNANDATQVSGSRMPILAIHPSNGLAAVHFDGADDQLALDENLFQASSGPLSIFIVLATTDDNGHVVGTGSSSAGFLRTYGQGIVVSNSRPATKANSGSQLFVEAPQDITDDLPHVISGRIDANFGEVVASCTAPMVTTEAATPWSYQRSAIGASGTSTPRDPLAGSVFEIVVYTRLLTEEERHQVRDYLAVKYDTAFQGVVPSDLDGDGLYDECDPDRDGDGLLNGVETNTGIFVSVSDTGTDPDNPDSDFDTFTDGEEVAAGTDPNDDTNWPVDPQFEDLRGWEVVQYNDCQGAANWTFDLVGRQALQSVNCAPAFLLGPEPPESTVTTGQMKAGSAPDFMGFVFGYQDSGRFYLFDWKKATASYCGGSATAGMRLRSFEFPSGDEPRTGDFWGLSSPVSVTELVTNDVPWAEDVEYEFRLTIDPSNVRIEVSEVATGTLLEDWGFPDLDGVSGRFGLHVNSLQGVTFGPLRIESTAGIFVRGDTNADSNIDISDPVFILNYLFTGGPAQCLLAADTNDDELVDISDTVYLLSWLFTPGSPAPPEPSTCGTDPTPSGLDCQKFDPCP